MIMPQTESLAFNDILTFNITSATTQLTSIGDNKKEATTTALSAQGINNRKRNSLSFFSNENSTNPNALLNSTIFTNNFFSNLITNDYLDNKDSYYAGDLIDNKNSLSSSPLSSGLSSLSSSLNSSITSVTGNSLLFLTSSESMSRSSSTGSLQLDPNQAIIKNETNNQCIIKPTQPDATLSQRISPKSPRITNNPVLVGSDANFSQTHDISSNMVSSSLEPRSIDWHLLNNTDTLFFNQNTQEADCKWMKKLNAEFAWNINQLTELALATLNSANITNNNSYIAKANANGAKVQHNPPNNNNINKKQIRQTQSANNYYSYNQQHQMQPNFLATGYQSFPISLNSIPKQQATSYGSQLNVGSIQQQQQPIILFKGNTIMNHRINTNNRVGYFQQRC